MKAIVLAGGVGSRLSSVVSDVPKPMAPVAGRPFLEYMLDYLISQGVQEVLLSVGYMHEKIQSHFGDKYKSLQVSYCVELTRLGTGGAIKKAFDESGFFSAVVLNGDTFFNIDLARLKDLQETTSTNSVFALKHLDDVGRYGKIALDDHNGITAFDEKGVSGEGVINGGVYLINKVLFDACDLPEAFSFESEFISKKLDEIQPKGVVYEDYFLDIGIPEDFEKAQVEIPKLLG